MTYEEMYEGIAVSETGKDILRRMEEINSLQYRLNDGDVTEEDKQTFLQNLLSRQYVNLLDSKGAQERKLAAAKEALAYAEKNVAVCDQQLQHIEELFKELSKS